MGNEEIQNQIGREYNEAFSILRNVKGESARVKDMFERGKIDAETAESIKSALERARKYAEGAIRKLADVERRLVP